MDRLGKRLAAGGPVSAEDLVTLREIYRAHQSALAHALELIDAQPASRDHLIAYRVKTTGTLVEKLRREHTSLKSMQDIAGIRVICDNTHEQDQLVFA